MLETLRYNPKWTSITTACQRSLGVQVALSTTFLFLLAEVGVELFPALLVASRYLRSLGSD